MLRKNITDLAGLLHGHAQFVQNELLGMMAGLMTATAMVGLRPRDANHEKIFDQDEKRVSSLPISEDCSIYQAIAEAADRFLVSAPPCD